MPTYRLNYGEVREFEAQGAGEVVPELQRFHRTGGCDTEAVFIRRLAMEMCEWSGGFGSFDGSRGRKDFSKGGIVSLL